MQVYEICGLTTTRYTVSDLKFSPSGDILAVGSHDPKKRIEFFSVTPQAQQSALERLNRVVNKHSSYVTHLDFSTDGAFLQSNCGAYELLFTDVQTGKQITSASKLRDEVWATWTCVLGSPVQGIWPASSDGTDINAVDRSHSGNLLATADDFGKIKLFRYPCAATDAEAHEYSGHSAHVTNVRWTESDEFVISVGGNDKTVFVWRLT
jgi:microtubule-associated protein-like 6